MVRYNVAEISAMVPLQASKILITLFRTQNMNLKEKPDISLFFPVYNDELTVERVAQKSLAVLAEIAAKYEVIIVDDGTPCKAGKIADELAATDYRIKVIHHPQNLGYGQAVRTGLENSAYELICFTDGDDEYDVNDLHKLIRLHHYYDLIITFRYVKAYSGFRIFISWVYNIVLRTLFKTKYRDISTGLRLIRRDLVKELNLQSSSPFIGAEIAIKTMLKGYRVGEVGIQTFPREFGKGASTSIPNIIATIKDMVLCYQNIFSKNYDLPPNRIRKN